MKYLDSVALAQLARLSLHAGRFASEGAASGRHRSLSRGASHEFSQHRPYAPGDEPRTLDWKVYARQDRFYVREYNEETLLSASILVDASASMGFSGKWDLACRLSMAMAYLIVSRGDAAGLSLFDVEPREFIPPRAARSHLELLDEALSRASPARKTDVARALELAAARIKRRSLLILVSDLLGDPEKNMSVLKALKARKHEVMVLQVLDARERDLDYDGPTVFQGLEDGERLLCDAGRLRQSYRREFDRLMRHYEATFHRSEIAYGVFYCDRPWDAALGRFLSRVGS